MSTVEIFQLIVVKTKYYFYSSEMPPSEFIAHSSPILKGYQK